MAPHAPAIATDPGGIPTFVTDGETGLFVAPWATGRPGDRSEPDAGLARAASRSWDRGRSPRLRRPHVGRRGCGGARRAPCTGSSRGGGSAVRMLMVTKFLPLPDNNGGHQRSL